MQGTVKYSEEFITPDGRKYWVGHEMQYDQDTQDPPFEKCAKAALSYAAQKTKAYEMVSMAVTSYPPLNEIQVEKEPEIGTKPEHILSSPDLKTLESYKYIKNGNKELERAYILRHDQLTQKQ